MELQSQDTGMVSTGQVGFSKALKQASLVSQKEGREQAKSQCPQETFAMVTSGNTTMIISLYPSCCGVVFLIGRVEHCDTAHLDWMETKNKQP